MPRLTVTGTPRPGRPSVQLAASSPRWLQVGEKAGRGWALGGFGGERGPRAPAPREPAAPSGRGLDHGRGSRGRTRPGPDRLSRASWTGRKRALPGHAEPSEVAALGGRPHLVPGDNGSPSVQCLPGPQRLSLRPCHQHEGPARPGCPPQGQAQGHGCAGPADAHQGGGGHWRGCAAPGRLWGVVRMLLPSRCRQESVVQRPQLSGGSGGRAQASHRWEPGSSARGADPTVLRGDWAGAPASGEVGLAHSGGCWSGTCGPGWLALAWGGEAGPAGGGDSWGCRLAGPSGG